MGLTELVSLLGKSKDMKELEARKRDLDEQKGLLAVLIKSLVGSAGEIYKNIKRREKYQEKAEQERKRNMEATNKARGVADQEEHKKAVALAGRAQPFQINLEKHNPTNEYPEVIALS